MTASAPLEEQLTEALQRDCHTELDETDVRNVIEAVMPVVVPLIVEHQNKTIPLFRSACGFGSMDDDNHALYCVACNIARWGEWRRAQRWTRPPGKLRHRWNRIMRFVVEGDPLLLPDQERVGHVR